jgi:hypothetical protein
MTMPRGLHGGMSIDDAPLGEKLGRSWILLGRVVPVDYDDLCLVERGPGMRFLERSQMLSARVWQHEREVITTGPATCEVADRLELELRTPLRVVGGAAIARRVVRFLFTQRHRRLRQRWGDGGSAAASGDRDEDRQ